jgi:hypothetical protein
MTLRRRVDRLEAVLPSPVPAPTDRLTALLVADAPTAERMADYLAAIDAAGPEADVPARDGLTHRERARRLCGLLDLVAERMGR